jgi:uncharacterized protein (DUF342 family)
MKKLLMTLVLLGTTLFSEAQYRNGKDRVYTRNDNHRPAWNENDNSSNRGRSGRIDSFQRNAREHIAQGIIEGTITSRESAQLLEMAERVEQKENRYKRRGGLSRREVSELKNYLKRLDRRIYRERRDWDRQSNDDRQRKRN